MKVDLNKIFHTIAEGIAENSKGSKLFEEAESALKEGHGLNSVKQELIGIRNPFEQLDRDRFLKTDLYKEISEDYTHIKVSKPIATKKPQFIKSIKDSNSSTILSKSDIKKFIKKTTETNPDFNIAGFYEMLNELSPNNLKKYQNKIFQELASNNSVSPTTIAKKFNFLAELDKNPSDSLFCDKIEDLCNAIKSEEQLNLAKNLHGNNVFFPYITDIIKLTSGNKALQDIAINIKPDPGSGGYDLLSCIKLAKKSPENLEKIKFIVSKTENIQETYALKLMNRDDLTLEKIKEESIDSLLPKSEKELTASAEDKNRTNIGWSEFKKYYDETCLKLSEGDKEKAINLLAEKVGEIIGIKKIILSFNGRALADEGELPLTIEEIEKRHVDQLFSMIDAFQQSKYKAGEIAGFIYPGHSEGFGKLWGNETINNFYKFIDENFEPGEKVLLETCDWAMPAQGGHSCIGTAKLVIAHQHGLCYVEPEYHACWIDFGKRLHSRVFSREELVGENEEVNALLKSKGFQRTWRNGNWWIEFSDEYLAKLGKKREDLVK